MTTTIAAADLIDNPPAPGTDAWFQYMTGSKIAAVLRLSPYESYYSLWHRMAGIVEPQPEKDIMRRGHYLEPGILAWLADRHDDLEFGPAGMWASRTDPRFAITPDGLAYDPAAGEWIVVEAKTALDKDIWGEELSDEIPVYYRCQVMWAMGILGLSRAIVGVLTSFLEFREFEVRFSQAEFDLLVSEADRFLQSLADRDAPDIDSHSATYEVVRAMHPDILDIPIDVPVELAVGYVDSKLAESAAKSEALLWTARLADHMANCKTAKFAGKTIATRQTRGGTPFVQAARGLKPITIDILEEAS